MGQIRVSELCPIKPETDDSVNIIKASDNYLETQRLQGPRKYRANISLREIPPIHCDVRRDKAEGSSLIEAVKLIGIIMAK